MGQAELLRCKSGNRMQKPPFHEAAPPRLGHGRLRFNTVHDQGTGGDPHTMLDNAPVCQRCFSTHTHNASNTWHICICGKSTSCSDFPQTSKHRVMCNSDIMRTGHALQQLLSREAGCTAGRCSRSRTDDGIHASGKHCTTCRVCVAMLLPNCDQGQAQRFVAPPRPTR